MKPDPFCICRREVQEKMFADTLTLLVKNIDDVEKTVPELTTLATRHVRYGVQEAHFPPVGGSLLGTLEKILGPSFTPAVREAWTELWGTATAVSGFFLS
jgi:hemoglobin-like flavoprotein